MDFGLRKRGKVWYYDFFINSKRYRASTQTQSKDLAYKCAQQIYNEVYQNHYRIKPARTKISDFIKYHLTVDEGNISQGWYNIKVLTLKSFEKYVSQSNILYLDQINLSHLEAYKAKLLKSVKPKTAKNYLIGIKTMLNHAVKSMYLVESPARHLGPIRQIEVNKKKYLSRNEVQAVINATKNTNIHGVVMTAIYTGMRRGELLSLEYPDIDIQKKLIYVRNKDGFQTKSRKERVLPLHDKLFEIFEKGGKGYCFPNENGGKLQRDTLTRTFKRIATALGMPEVRLHTLRHTFISHCLMSGISIWEVGKWVGHSSTYITELYGHLCPDRREIDKLTI